MTITGCILKQREGSLGKDNSKLLLGPSFRSGQQIYWASSDKALNEDSPVISLGQTLRHRTKEEKDDWFCVVNPNALTNVVGQTLWVKLEMIHQLLITVESKGALTPLINQWSLTLNLRETCTAETYRHTYSNIKLSDEERTAVLKMVPSLDFVGQ